MLLRNSRMSRRRKDRECQLRTLRREWHLSLTMIIVAAAFMVCWGPFIVTFFKDTIEPIKQRYLYLTVLIGYTNSAINPVVYAIMNKQFRGALKQLLRKYLPGGNRFGLPWK